MIEITRKLTEDQYVLARTVARPADETFSALRTLHIVETSLSSFRWTTPAMRIQCWPRRARPTTEH